MHYEIYIDVVFFTNLLIDYILIRLQEYYSDVEEAEKELFWELLQVRCFPAGSFICNLF